jgi:hypothetical protein
MENGAAATTPEAKGLSAGAASREGWFYLKFLSTMRQAFEMRPRLRIKQCAT